MLKQRGIETEPSFLQVIEQPCMVLELEGRAIAVDPGSGYGLVKPGSGIVYRLPAP